MIYFRQIFYMAMTRQNYSIFQNFRHRNTTRRAIENRSRSRAARFKMSLRVADHVTNRNGTAP